MSFLREKLSLNQMVLIVLIVVAFSSSLFSFIVDNADRTAEWWSGWSQNFSTEVFGAIMTFALFELLVGGRKERVAEAKKIEELKARLVREAGSSEKVVAISAINEIKANNWMEGENSILKRARLSGADLRGADMFKANLEAVDFWEANLVGVRLNAANLKGAGFGKADLTNAILRFANLSFANLDYAILQGADLLNTNLSNVQADRIDLTNAILQSANLSNAYMGGANLSNADLSGANLCGANLRQANLVGANLDRTNFNGKTVLPDAEDTKKHDDQGNAIYDKYWSPRIDMNRYTDPNHPDFSQPKWAKAGFGNLGDWLKAGKPDPDISPNP